MRFYLKNAFFVSSQLPKGVQSISVEIYDECNFTMDELIAWAEIKIPDSVLRGETFEEWFPLSGKQGEGLEGALQLVLSFSVPTTSYVYQPAAAPVVMIPNVSGRPMPVFVSPAQHPVQQPIIVPFTDAEIDQVMKSSSEYLCLLRKARFSDKRNVPRYRKRSRKICFGSKSLESRRNNQLSIDVNQINLSLLGIYPN